MSLQLSWSRPADVPFPSVWLRFKAKDTESDDLVDYVIQDLPEDRFEDAVQHMTDHYLVDEPIAKCYNALEEHPDFIEDYQRVWRAVLPQRMTLVCFKEGSDEIAGMNVSYVVGQEDKFGEQLTNNTTSAIMRTMLAVNDAIAAKVNFNLFEKYSVEHNFAEFGLSVSSKYRRRKIGEYLFRARKEIGQVFGLKLTSVFFSSDFSDKCATNAGFHPESEYTWDELQKLNPEFTFPNIQSRAYTLQTWVF